MHARVTVHGWHIRRCNSHSRNLCKPSDGRDSRLPFLSQPFFLAGTFAPFFRAFERPMAMACFRLVAFADLPLFCVPSLVLWTAFFTSFFAAEPYFAIAFSFQVMRCCTRCSFLTSKYRTELSPSMTSFRPPGNGTSVLPLLASKSIRPAQLSAWFADGTTAARRLSRAEAGGCTRLPFAALSESENSALYIGRDVNHAAHLRSRNSSDPSCRCTRNRSKPGRRRPAKSGSNGRQAQKGTRAAVNDALFAAAAADGGLSELALSELGAQRATDPELKCFSEKMIQEHTRMNAELKDLAGRKGMRLPAEVNYGSQFCAQSLSGLTGEDFDHCYAKAQLVAHMQAVALFEAEAERGADREVSALAAKALTHIKEHLRMIKPIAKKYMNEDDSENVRENTRNIRERPSR